MIESHRLRWRENALLLDGKGAPLAHIVPDGRHPSMWRVQLPDGHLTDMVNLTRAKDAAVSIVLGLLNKKQCRETSAEAPSIRSLAEAATIPSRRRNRRNPEPSGGLILGPRST